MKVLIIPADRAENVRIEDVTIDLDYLQEKVGGSIEAVGHDGVNFYLNEEGKITGLMPNYRATRYAKRHGMIAMLDTIVGNVVAVGPVDDEGYDTGLSGEQVAQILREAE